MNSKKAYCLALLVANLLFSCSSKSNGNEEVDFVKKEKNDAMNNTDNIDDQTKGFKYNPIYDHDNGMVMSQIPMPTTWKYFPEKDAPIVVTGPDNLKVFKSDIQVFAYATNDFALQSLYQNQRNMPGTTIAPVRSLEQMVQEARNYFERNRGMQFIKSYPIPKYVAFFNRFAAGVLNTGAQTQYQVLGSDWKDGNGKMYFVLFTHTNTYREGFIDWRFNTTMMESSASGFEKSKADYIYGLENTQINMEWQRTMNNKLLQNIRNNEEYWRRATAQLLVGHQQRMADINARGNTSNALAKTYSDILDINHAGYLNRSNIVGNGQSNTVAMINETSIISNPASGERYQVDQGSKFYWVNQNGQYIGTDNSFYDPRMDKAINKDQWTIFGIER